MQIQRAPRDTIPLSIAIPAQMPSSQQFGFSVRRACEAGAGDADHPARELRGMPPCRRKQRERLARNAYGHRGPVIAVREVGEIACDPGERLA